MSLRVIDTSSWQTGLDLSQIDFDAIMVKATESTSYVNPSCDSHMQQAIRQGKLNGVYHFARPADNDPFAEANFFVDNIQGYLDGTTLLCLDWESEPKGNVTWARQWLDHVFSRTGVRPVIYMSESVVNGHDWSSVYNDYGLWVARYQDMSPDYNWDMSNAGPLPDVNWNPSAPYMMWQWTSRGRLNGYGADLDLSVFYGDKNTWLAYSRNQNVPVLQPTPEPVPTPTPDPTPAPEPVPEPTPTPEPPVEQTRPIVKAFLELFRLVVFALPALLIQLLTNDPGLAFGLGTPLLALLKTIDKYVHENPDSDISGLLPF